MLAFPRNFFSESTRLSIQGKDGYLKFTNYYFKYSDLNPLTKVTRGLRLKSGDLHKFTELKIM